MAKSPLKMMSVLNFFHFYTCSVGLNSLSSQGRRGFCPNMGAFLLTTYFSVVVIIVAGVHVGGRSLQEPGTWPSAPPASPWAIHLCLPSTVRASPSQICRHGSRKWLLFSLIPCTQFGEWSEPNGDKLWELYLWSAG